MYKGERFNSISHLLAAGLALVGASVLLTLAVVEGDGVIGEKPVLAPKKSYTYSSYCNLTSPTGAMKGFYNMINFTNTSRFKVQIPNFQLTVPAVLN